MPAADASMSTDAPAPVIDPRLFRDVMGRFATGVTVLTCACAGQPIGMTLNAFMAVSLHPPLVLVSVRKASRLVRQIRVGSRFGINILAEHQRPLGPHFSRRPAPGAAVRFIEHAGVPLLEGSLAHLVARVTEIHPAGDHLLYIAAVEHLADGADAEPLIFFSGRYKQVHAHAPPP